MSIAPDRTIAVTAVPGTAARGDPGRGHQLLRHQPALIALVAGLVSAVVTSSTLTGSSVVDLALRAGLAAAFTLAATVVGPRWWLASAIALAVGGADAGELLWVGAGLVGGGALLRLDHRRALAGAAWGACTVQAALSMASLRAPDHGAIAGGAVAALVLGVAVVNDAGHRRVWLALLAGVAGWVLLAAGSFALTLHLQRAPLERSMEAIWLGIDAAEQGDSTTAHARLGEATAGLEGVRGSLTRPWLAPARTVPVIAQHRAAALELLEIGQDIVAAADGVATELDDAGLRMQGGRIDVEAIGELEEPLQRAAAVLDEANVDLQDLRTTWLIPKAVHAIGRAQNLTAEARRGAVQAVDAVRVAPGLLGAEGPRRYFVLIQTPAELRGSGGLLGNYGILTAVDGRVALEVLGRNDDLNRASRPEDRHLTGPPDYVSRYATLFHLPTFWQNVTASPDFPSVAAVVAELYPQSGGAPIDGVLAIDPIAVAALLRLTGPVEVAGWPEPLTDENAARVLLHEQYVALDRSKDVRVDFLADASAAIFARLTTGQLPGPGVIASAMGPAVRGRHVQMVSFDAEEADLLERLEVDGALPEPGPDVLGLVTQNSTQAKIDWFLRRHIRYDVSYDPRSGSVEATVTVRLENGAPRGGLPAYVLGGLSPDPKQPGTNELYLSLYSPHEVVGATIDGQPVTMERDTELGHVVHSVFVVIPAKKARTLEVRLEGRLEPGQAYRLEVVGQPTVVADQLTVDVRGVNGWPVVGATGLDVADGRGHTEQALERPLHLEATFR